MCRSGRRAVRVAVRAGGAAAGGAAAGGLRAGARRWSGTRCRRSCRARSSPEAARPDVPAGFRREPGRATARPSAAAARKVRALRGGGGGGGAALAQAERLAPPGRRAWWRRRSGRRSRGRRPRRRSRRRRRGSRRCGTWGWGGSRRRSRPGWRRGGRRWRRCGAWRRRCSGRRRGRTWRRRRGSGRRRRRCRTRRRRRCGGRRRVLDAEGVRPRAAARDARGGAAFGGCFGGASFDSPPGGPACAITTGAVCACDEGCELRSREGGGGEQHEANVCHDSSSPRKNLEQQTRCLSAEASAHDQQITVRPDCGGNQIRRRFYFECASAWMRIRSRRIQMLWFAPARLHRA